MSILTTRKARPAYRLRPSAAVDSYGDPVDGWAAPERTRLRGAQVQDGGIDAQTERETPTSRLAEGERLLIVSGLADLTIDDRIEVDGEVWHIQGAPFTRRSLASGVITVARLSRTVRTQ